jgi:endonuclease/exonuclease/phosphatase family metal-dependent hydrolase
MVATLIKIVFALALLGTAVACTQIIRNSGSQELSSSGQGILRAATYNVHYIILEREEGAWSRGDWERRKTPLDLAFKEIDADFIAFQEMESFARGSGNRENLTLDWLLQNNPDYSAAASGDPAVFPSTQPILYKTARLKLRDQGWFFFSDTPDVIYSRTFNGSFPAFASWAQFTDRPSGADFRVVNVHTDFSSRSNRLQSMDLVAQRIKPWIEAGERVFVVGDLNGRRGSRELEILEQVGIDFVPVDGATYHFNRGINLFGAIDHIGFAGAVQTAGAPVVLRKQFAGEWPTDHYPVIVDLKLE